MREVFVCLFLFVAPLLAQARLQAGGVGATVPSFETSIGYVYFNMDMPSQRVGLTGLDANALVNFNSRWGATLDSAYARTGSVFGSGHSANVLSLVAGPVFYPAVFAKSAIFIHGLAGACRVESAIPATGTNYGNGWVARPSYSFGGGFEQSVFASLGIRIQGDYQHTSFGDSAGAIHGQNNVRLSTSIVYRFGSRR
jgi:hypothetical protein